MPVSFRPSEALALDKYGIFTKWRHPGFTIPAANAVSITAQNTGKYRAPHTVHPAYVTYDWDIPSQWGLIVERFNWGETSIPDKLYYEIWNWGVFLRPQEQEGYHCGGKVGYADRDNRSTHPAASKKLQVRFWNCSSPAEDIWVEFCMWYYTFPLANLDKILDMSFESLFDMLFDKLDKLNANIEKLTDVVRLSSGLVVPSPTIGER